MKVQVREVSSKGPSSLVEWYDEKGYVQRSSLPTELLLHENGSTYAEDPHEGVTPGEDWESLIELADSARVTTLLHQNGIWTYEDFLTNTPAVNGAFKEACAENYAKFVQAVHSRQSVQVERKE